MEATASAAATQMRVLQEENGRLKQRTETREAEVHRLDKTKAELERRTQVLRDRVHALEDLKTANEAAKAQLELKLKTGAVLMCIVGNNFLRRPYEIASAHLSMALVFGSGSRDSLQSERSGNGIH